MTDGEAWFKPSKYLSEERSNNETHPPDLLPWGDGYGWEPHPFYPLLRESRGLNGYVDEAWRPFIDAIEEARSRDYSHVPEPSEPTRPLEPRPVSATGYFAPDYAAQLRAAYESDPARFRSRGRSSFKALREAARLSEAQLRTVKRSVGYEGNALGFEDFIDLLFKEDGRELPK